MYHLDDHDIIGLCYRTLDNDAMTGTAAHLAWCEPCRRRADSFASLFADIDHWKTDSFPKNLPAKAIEKALTYRETQKTSSKLLRATGITPGDSFRKLRLGVSLGVSLLLLASFVGFLWASFAQDWQVTGELSIHANPVLLAGAQTSIQVKAASAFIDKSELSNIPISLDLVDVSQNDRILLHLEGETGVNGVSTFQLTTPAKEKVDQAALIARAKVDGEMRETRLPISLKREFRLHLSSDKPTYQPGQLVHLRALAFDRGTALPAEGNSARFEVYSPGGSKLSREETSVSKEGVSASEFELAPGAPLGEYQVVFTVEGRQQKSRFKVERYTLPPFQVTVKPLVSSTDGKNPFEVEVSAAYTFGQKLSSGTVRLSLSYSGSFVTEVQGKLTDGVVRLSIETLPEWIATRARYEGGVLGLRATVIDPANRAEEGRAFLALTRDSLLVDLQSEAPSLRRELPISNRILLKTSRPDGSPVATSIKILSPGDGENAIVGSGELVGTVETRSDGIGFLDLPPAFFGRPLAALAKDPQDGHELWRVFSAPPIRTGSLILRCDRALLRAGDSISCDVYQNDDYPKVLRADVDGFPVTMVQTPPKKGVSSVQISVPATVSGLLRLTVEGAPAQDAVFALVAPKEGLRVEIAGNVATKPGEETTLAFRVTDDQGRPRAAALGVALVDAAVFARTGGETPRQVLEALFGPIGVASEMMAILFPTQKPGKEGGRGAWTAVQQVEARWLLSRVYQEGAVLGLASSFQTDNQALQQSKRRAENFFETTSFWAFSVLFAVIVLVLLFYSFWFRALCFGLLLAFSAAFLAMLFVDEFLSIRNSTVETLGFVVGTLVLVLTVFWRYRMRPDPFGFVKDSYVTHRDQRRVWILGGASVLMVLFLFSMFSVGSKSYETSSRLEGLTMGFADNDSILATNTPSRASTPSPPRLAEPEYDAPEEVLSEKAFGNAEDESILSQREKEGEKKLLKNEEILDDAKAPAGQLGGLQEARVRKEFPETLYYNPSLVTDENGKANVSFRVADSITTWEIYTFASDIKGAVGIEQGGLEVFQEFFVDLDIPRDLIVGDTLALQVAVHNYQKKDLDVNLSLETDAGISIDSRALASPIRVPAQGVSSPKKPLLVTMNAPGTLKLTLTGNAEGKLDAILREVDVVPNGREVQQSFVGFVTDKTSRILSIPEYAQAGGRRIELTLYGSPIAQALDGLDLALAEPHGCFEQVSSTTYPNALILRALRAAGRSTPSLEKRALRLLRLGYQELLPYEVSGGGFSYFGDAPQITYLTAYGLLELYDMSSLIEVDTNLLQRLRDRLVTVQDSNGGFGGPAESAYVTLALVTSDPSWNEKEDPEKPWSTQLRQSRLATKRALENLLTSFSVTDGVDAYTLALAANAFAETNTPDYQIQAKRILDTLDIRASITGSGLRRRVTFQSSGGTLYGSYGDSAEVETTALVAYALVRLGDRPERTREVLQSLVRLRDPSGGFYSTQGMVLALRALLAAIETSNVSGTAIVSVDGNNVASVSFDTKNADLPQTVDLTEFVSSNAEITVSTEDSTSLGTDVSYRLRTRLL